jgi:hypothetical protein
MDIPFGDEVKLRLCLRECLDNHRLTAASLSDNHRRMSSEHHFVKLNHFVDLHRDNLEPVLRERLLDGFVDRRIPHSRHVKPWEKVRDEALEEWHIFKDKLRQIHVAQCPHQHHVLGKIRVATLERTSHHKDRFESPEPEIVVMLL